MEDKERNVEANKEAKGAVDEEALEDEVEAMMKAETEEIVELVKVQLVQATPDLDIGLVSFAQIQTLLGDDHPVHR